MTYLDSLKKEQEVRSAYDKFVEDKHRVILETNDSITEHGQLFLNELDRLNKVWRDGVSLEGLSGGREYPTERFCGYEIVVSAGADEVGKKGVSGFTGIRG